METLHLLCNNGFRVGMLEVNNFKFLLLCIAPQPKLCAPEANLRFESGTSEVYVEPLRGIW